MLDLKLKSLILNSSSTWLMSQTKLKLLDSLMIYRLVLLNQAQTFATQQNSSCLRNSTKLNWVALNQIHPTKAPRPDGMSAIFFQNYWGIVGKDVICMILNVLSSNMSMAEINKTNITLVPKIKKPPQRWQILDLLVFIMLFINSYLKC